jgi:hypothetical protein
MTNKSSPYLDVKSISLCCLQGCTFLRRIYGLQKSGFTIGHYDATRHPVIATVEIGLIASGRDTHRTRIASKHMDRLALSTPKPTMHWNCFRRTAQHTITIWSLFGAYRRTTGVTMPRLGETLRGRCEVWKRGRRGGRRSTQLAPCKRNQEADSGMQTIRLKRRANRCWYRFSQNRSRDCLVSSALLRNGTSLKSVIILRFFQQNKVACNVRNSWTKASASSGRGSLLLQLLEPAITSTKFQKSLIA